MRLRTIIIILMSTLFLIVSCNTDNDGIFMQVSKSEEKTDVGSIILLNKVGTTFYARTRQHQLQTYDSANRKWTLIDDAKATHATAAANNIYYAASVKEVEGNHEIKNLSDPNDSNKDFKIIAMDPLYDLMLVKNSDGNFDIHQVSTKNKVDNSIENLVFYDDYTPQLITQGLNLFVVSGKTASDKYTHYLYDGSKNEIDNINSPVVAMLKDGDGKVALLTSKGEIYTAPNSGADFTKADGKVVPNFPTTRRPAGAPYPAFVFNDKLYLQNRHNYLYTIDSSGEVKPDDDIDLVAVKGWSYLVDGGTVYVGTSQNGIYEIDMATKKVTAL